MEKITILRNEQWFCELLPDGSIGDYNTPDGTVGFAYNSPLGELVGFFGDEKVELAEEIAKEDDSLIVWLA